MEQIHHEWDEIGIAAPPYQRRAEFCTQSFLRTFPRTPKAYRINIYENSDNGFSLKLNENPPSIQVQQFPKGGRHAGVLRIKEQLVRQNVEQIVPLRTDDVVPLGSFQNPETLLRQLETMNSPETPANQLARAAETDITRECIILTLTDPTLQIMLAQGLIPPEKFAQLLQNIKTDRPDDFLVLQRYLLGIEPEYNSTVPFSVIERDDDPAFEYLEALPSQLC